MYLSKLLLFQIQNGNNVTIGREVLKSHGLDFDGNFFWISVGALLGFAVVFDIGFILALTYLKGKSCLSYYKETNEQLFILLNPLI